MCLRDVTDAPALQSWRPSWTTNRTASAGAAPPAGRVAWEDWGLPSFNWRKAAKLLFVSITCGLHISMWRPPYRSNRHVDGAQLPRVIQSPEMSLRRHDMTPDALDHAWLAWWVLASALEQPTSPATRKPSCSLTARAVSRALHDNGLLTATLPVAYYSLGIDFFALFSRVFSFFPQLTDNDKYSRDNLMLYPYHLSDVLIKSVFSPLFCVAV
jgi:hypothetical protein